MKSVSKIILTVIEIGLIVAAAIGFFAYSQSSMQPVTVYEFSRNMKTNTILTENDVVAKKVPSKGVSSNQVTKKEDVIGFALTTNVYQGEFVVKDHLVESENIDIFESMDLSNYRKFSISADYLLDSPNGIVRGDKVDLLYVGNFEVDSDKAQYMTDVDHVLTDEFTYSTTFKQGVLVYDVLDADGNRYSGNKPETTQVENVDQNSEEQAQAEEVAKAATIVLALTPEQYEELAVRLETGQVKILSRFEGSEDIVSKGYVYGDSYPVKQGEGIIEFE